MSDEPVPAIVSRDVGFDDLFVAQQGPMTRLAYLLTGSTSQAEDS